VGSDLSVDFLQSMLERSNGNLFDGRGEQALISGNGRLVAWTGEGAAAGESASAILDSVDQANLRQLKEEPIYEVDRVNNLIELWMPVPLGDSAARWALLFRLPLDVVMADLAALDSELAEQQSSAAGTLMIIGVLIALAGLGVMLLVGYNLARPRSEEHTSELQS